MVAGHFAASFAAKAYTKRFTKHDVPLWLLLLASQFLDLIWGFAMVLGWERGDIVDAPGLAALKLTQIGWSHSLFMAFVWALLAALVVGGLQPKLREGDEGKRKLTLPLAVGLVVLMHWLLDWSVHEPNLPVSPSGAGEKFGLNLWGAYPGIALLLELGLLVGTFLWYRFEHRTRVVPFASGEVVPQGGMAEQVEPKEQETGTAKRDRKKGVVEQFKPGHDPRSSRLLWILVIVQVGLAFGSMLGMMRWLTFDPRLDGERAAQVLAAITVVALALIASWFARVRPDAEPDEATTAASTRSLDVFGIALIFFALFLLAQGIVNVVDPTDLSALQRVWPFSSSWMGLLVASRAVLLAFMLLVGIGITLIGYARATRQGKDGPTWFWYLGCDSLNKGIRVLFLIPISLACWMGIIAAFDVVWRYSPSQQMAPQVERELDNPDYERGIPKDTAEAGMSTAQVQPGIPDSATTMQIWILDGQRRRVPDELRSGRLKVTVISEFRLPADELRAARDRVDTTVKRGIKRIERTVPYEYRAIDGAYVATWTPARPRFDTVYVELDSARIGDKKPILSRVAYPAAPSLPQRANLWFLPIAIVLAAMLLWPSEPDDRTKSDEVIARNARAVDAQLLLINAFDFELRQRGADLLRDATAAADPELQRFVADHPDVGQEVLDRVDFSDAAAKLMLASIAKAAIDAGDTRGKIAGDLAARLKTARQPRRESRAKQAPAPDAGEKA